MKKTVTLLLTAVLVLLSFGVLAGCNTYNVPENHCIVGLSTSYTLYSEAESKFCSPVDNEIRGVEKELNYNYYSVVKGANYTICVDDYIESWDGGNGWGPGLDGDYLFSAAYWQGQIIRVFSKEYGKNSELQDEIFYTTDLKRIGGNVTTFFNRNCTVRTVAEPYIYCGGIYEIIDKNADILNSKIGEYLDEYGIIHEQDGFYYLLLVDEVCPHRDAWKTNLDITDYSYEYIEGGWAKSIRAKFTCKPINVGENQELALNIICRTLSGKYFVASPVYVGAEGFGMSVREHELKLTFEQQT